MISLSPKTAYLSLYFCSLISFIFVHIYVCFSMYLRLFLWCDVVLFGVVPRCMYDYYCYTVLLIICRA